ncbi:MAG: uracil-DNA glycosylase [Nitrospirota bacterium]
MRDKPTAEDASLAEYAEYLRDAGVLETWGPDSFRWEAPTACPSHGGGTGGENAPNDFINNVGRDAPGAPNAPAESYPGLSDVKTLDGLREFIGDCKRCKLHKARTNIVFGVGNPEAKLAFVGEGPGRDEDIKGEPFVGRAGQLLTDIIEKGMKLMRSDVYIANVVKCRPPENRNPEEDEIAACEPFLKKQLEIIGPEFICTLGKFATQTLLKTKEPISQLRGSWREYEGIRLIPTFHPAYLLRNPNDKKLVWADVQKLMAEYNGETSPQPPAPPPQAREGSKN